MRKKLNRKNRIKRKKFIIFIILIFSTIFISLTINEICSIHKPTKIEKIISIPEKSSVDKIAKILKKEKIISSVFLFKAYLFFKDYKNLKSGKFKLKTNESYNLIFKTLYDNSNICYDEKINFFEGTNFFTIKNRNNDISTDLFDDIIKEINDEKNYSEFSFIEKCGKENLEKTYFPMEGLIAPYVFPIKENSNAKSIAKEILKKSDERLSKLFDKFQQSECFNLSFWEILTLASIIESETSDVNEMKKVSGVFHNRLKINKRLESDVTTNYFKKISEDLKNKNSSMDLQKFKDYNTYHCKKLPLGPICIPSDDAVFAAINPAKEDYYFFYADHRTNKILYAKNFEEHKQNYSK